MSEHIAQVTWLRGPNKVFVDNQYSQGHQWQFDGGAVVAASSSPSFVPLPISVENNVDPEEAFVATLSSCHMLFFLSLAAKHRWTLDLYADNATRLMAEDDEGRLAMTQVTLYPGTHFSGKRLPTRGDTDHIHHQAHDLCFIANSVKTVVTVEPVF